MKTHRFENAPFLVSTGENGDEKLKASHTVPAHRRFRAV